MHPLFKERVKVSEDTGCWEWLKYKDKQGYGRATHQGRRVFAHRLSYMLHVGPIQDGLTVDHLCFNTGCSNPDHLQLLTHEDNAKRQRSALATHCSSGHLFDESNTYTKPGFRNGNRQCRRCNLDAVRRYQQRRRDKGIAA